MKKQVSGLIIVSACLAGINCRYDGKSSEDPWVIELVGEGKAVPVCPEQLGGLESPRPPAEICGGTGADVLDGKCRVKREDGTDVTDAFVKGSFETLKEARDCKAKLAVFRSKSPSCGMGKVYDGSFSNNTIKGNGVAAELLLRNGIRVITEKKAEKKP